MIMTYKYYSSKKVTTKTKFISCTNAEFMEKLYWTIFDFTSVLNKVASECVSPGMDYLYSTAAINLCTYFAY